VATKIYVGAPSYAEPTETSTTKAEIMPTNNETSIEDNKRLVRQFCEHFKTSNADGLIDAMTEDATWWVKGKPHLFSSSGIKTKEEAARMFRSMFSAYIDGLDMQVINMIGEGDSVAAEARSYATTKTGKVYQNEYTDLMHVQEIFG
jgi:ketosteroid isomerase-like protein